VTCRNSPLKRLDCDTKLFEGTHRGFSSYRRGRSAVAMTMRLHSLGMLTYYHYNRLYVELSNNSYRTNEPFSVKPETSQVWQNVFSESRRDGFGVQWLADILLLPADEIIKLVFGLVTIGLTTLVRGSKQRRGHLTVIK
jgi:hypothetical protein